MENSGEKEFEIKNGEKQQQMKTIVPETFERGAFLNQMNFSEFFPEVWL